MSLILVGSERFAEHQTPPGHPDSPRRAQVMDAVAAEWRWRRGEVVAPRIATHEQLARVHDDAYLRQIAATSGQATALDPDTFTSPETFDVAGLAAGAAVDAVERVMATAGTRAFALARPPGHHAERARAMGFCVYNNVAIAAAHARTLGASRVAIVDYDVHHGNGTQQIFESDPNVLYVSTHQHPYYPGTGDAREVGREGAMGLTVNVPLEAGATNDDYRVVFADIVVPVLTQFAPDLVLLSAGFDAHQRDPLGGMRLTTDAFAAMTLAVRDVAERCCGGRLALVTEGGYDLATLRDSLLAVVDALADDAASAPSWPSSAFQSTRGQAAVRAVRASHEPYWRF